MNSDRRRQVEALYRAVLSRAAGERAAFLADACTRDDALRREVESLLANPALDSTRTARSSDDRRHTPMSTAEQWGEFRLLGELGRGAFGRVYRAWDAALEREVALKITQVPDPARASAVLREGRMLARVRHRNVVSVYGAQQIAREVGLWMELVRGRHLAEIVRQDGPMGPEETTVAGISICQALAAVHGAGLIHRDVKAHNVMRESGGRVVLMDFGAGRDADLSQQRAAHDITGTPVYMAPELFAGRPASPASDIYSLGVLLFYLLTREYPVEGRTLAELAISHAAGQRRLLSDCRPDLPTGIVRVVERALSPVPEQRSRSAGSMMQELADAIHGASGSWRDRLAEALDPSETKPSESGLGLDRAVETRKGREPSQRSTWRLAGVIVAIALASGLAAVGINALLSKHSVAPLEVRSVAVLPFDAPGAPEVGDLAAGLSGDVVRELQQFDLGVKRVSQRSVLGDGLDKRLGVDLLVRGLVERGPSTTALTVRLVRAGSGDAVWTHRYDEVEAMLPALPRRAARDIADELGVTSRSGAPAPSYQANYAAYEAYQRGRALFELRTAPELKRSLEFFQRAASLDPRYAEPWAGEADAYIELGVAAFGPLSPVDAQSLTKEAALQALDRNPDLAEAHTSLAFAAYFYDWAWAAAEKRFKKAIDLNPQYAQARHWYADFLNAMGRQGEAMDEIHRAQALEPLSIIISRDVAWHLFFQRKYDDAVTQLRRTLLMDSGYAPARTLLARALAALGRYPEALGQLHAAQGTTRGANLSFVAFVQASSGDRVAAMASLRDLRNLPPSEHVAPYYLALVEVALGRPAAALDELERGYRERDSTMVNLNVDPRFDSIRNEARFRALVRRMEFPPTTR